MGLTIQYNLEADTDSPEGARRLVEDCRQLALNLPFAHVGQVLTAQGKECDFEARRTELQSGDPSVENLFGLLIHAGQYVGCPWNKHIRCRVNPVRVVAFTIGPGAGCEPAEMGLCLYPAEIEWEYKVQDDQRFQEARPGGIWQEFSHQKWSRYCQRHHGMYRCLEEFTERRQVPTGLTGWRWGSFCKTQYASNPDCGGVANFLKCHIGLITLLDRMAKLPGLKVSLDDEGKFGRSYYSDNWREADAAGRKRTYRWHKGQYDVAALARQVGEWNEMIAAEVGRLKDLLGPQLKSPITKFPNYEHLEASGRAKETTEASHV